MENLDFCDYILSRDIRCMKPAKKFFSPVDEYVGSVRGHWVYPADIPIKCRCLEHAHWDINYQEISREEAIVISVMET